MAQGRHRSRFRVRRTPVETVVNEQQLPQSRGRNWTREFVKGPLMRTVTIEDAQTHLRELIDRVQQGEDVIITRDQKVVARLVVEEDRAHPQRQLGTLKGTVRYMAEDFDAPLDDF